MPHVFISYVRENRDRVSRLVSALRDAGIEIWIDDRSILPGQLWKASIDRAIRDSAYFVACFSSESDTRHDTYMDDELAIAVDEMERRENGWFIPVRLDAAIAYKPTLRGHFADVQFADLSHDWDVQIRRLISILKIGPPASRSRQSVEKAASRNITERFTFNADEQNRCKRIRVLTIATDSDASARLTAEVRDSIVTHLCAMLFDVSSGNWNTRKLLIRLPASAKVTIYVIYQDLVLAARIATEIKNMRIADDVVTLSALAAVRASSNITTSDLVGNADALIVVRTVDTKLTMRSG